MTHRDLAIAVLCFFCGMMGLGAVLPYTPPKNPRPRYGPVEVFGAFAFAANAWALWTVLNG